MGESLFADEDRILAASGSRQEISDERTCDALGQITL